jgi:hypothetical protein
MCYYWAQLSLNLFEWFFPQPQVVFAQVCAGIHSFEYERGTLQTQELNVCADLSSQVLSFMNSTTLILPNPQLCLPNPDFT